MPSLVEILKRSNAAFGTNSASLDVSLQLMADGFASFLALPDSENRMLGIVALYIRPWWRRVWTTQEIGLAQRAEVYCGDKHLPWDYFVLFSDMLTIRPVLDVLQRHNPRSEAGRKALGGLPAVIAKARSVWDMWARRKTDKINLSFLVHTTFDRLATDPRDKIYALLGLVNEGATLEPDYTLNTSKVYTAGFKAMLQDNKDLRTFSLLLEGNLSRNQTLPSWVPDLQAISQTRNLVPLSGLVEGKAGRIYSASPPTDKYSEFSVGFEENDAVLLLEGVAVDVLDYIGDPAPSVQVDTFRGIQSSVKQTISQWKSSIVKKPGIYITGETISSAFWKTMVIDQKVIDYHEGFSKLEKERHQIRLDKPDKAIPPATPEQEERLIQVLDVSEGNVSHLSNRRFVTARKGYIGLAPPIAKNGDVVCVLLGGEVPYILRPLANGRYMMLGEWYVTEHFLYSIC
jgi:hypothetical protein